MSGLRQIFQILAEAADSSRINLIMWLCPHKTIKFEEARRMLLYKPPSANDNYMEKAFRCEDRACSTSLSHGIAHSGRGNWRTIGLITENTLLVVSNCDDHVQTMCQHFTTNRIKLALAQLDFPLCRHLRTSDPVVYNHYTPNCTTHRWMDGPPMDCKCPTAARRSSNDRAPPRLRGPPLQKLSEMPRTSLRRYMFSLPKTAPNSWRDKKSDPIN